MILFIKQKTSDNSALSLTAIAVALRVILLSQNEDKAYSLSDSANLKKG